MGRPALWLCTACLQGLGASAAPGVEELVLHEGRQAEYARDGLTLLPAAFGAELVEACRSFLDGVVWAPDAAARPPMSFQITTPGAFAPSGVYQTRGVAEPAKVRSQSYRLYGPETVPAPSPFHKLMFGPEVLRLVRRLLGGPISMMSGLLFERGTQQGLHEDTWYGLGGHSDGKLVSVYFALDDIQDENGPFLYVPGSQRGRPEPNYSQGILGDKAPRWRRMEFARKRAHRDIAYHNARRHLSQARQLRAKAGDIAFFHERLLHGGQAVQDRRVPRRSIVMHYRSWCNDESGCPDRYALPGSPPEGGPAGTSFVDLSSCGRQASGSAPLVRRVHFHASAQAPWTLRLQVYRTAQAPGDDEESWFELLSETREISGGAAGNVSVSPGHGETLELHGPTDCLGWHFDGPDPFGPAVHPAGGLEAPLLRWRRGPPVAAGGRVHFEGGPVFAAYDVSVELGPEVLGPAQQCESEGEASCAAAEVSA